MGDIKKENQRSIPSIRILTMLLLSIYGTVSFYCIYKILPENLKIFFIAFMGLGGFLLPFITIVVYNQLLDENENTSYYSYILFLSLYLVPIVLYGSYLVKLEKVRKYDFRLKNEKQIECELDWTFDVADTNYNTDYWKVELLDDIGRSIEKGESISATKYDLSNFIVKINCRGHSIFDTEHPEDSVDGTTVQKQLAYWMGEGFGESKTVKSRLLLSDDDEVSSVVYLTITMRRKYSAWDIIKSDIKREYDEIQLFNLVGTTCSNAQKYCEGYAGADLTTEIFADTNADRLPESEDNGILMYSYFNGEPCFVKVYLENDNVIGISANTHHLMSEKDALAYYKQISSYFVEQNKISNDDIIYEDDTTLMFCCDDRLYGIRVYEENGQYKVHASKFVYYENKENSNNSDITDETWGDLKDANGGELPYESLTEEQQQLINYPELNENCVYWVTNGKRYHAVDWCYTLENSKTILSGTLDEAIAAGKDTPCSKCVGR